MDADVDTLVTALYVEIDDLITRPRGRGRCPLLTDAELVCLAVMQVLLRYPSERTGGNLLKLIMAADAGAREG